MNNKIELKIKIDDNDNLIISIPMLLFIDCISKNIKDLTKNVKSYTIKVDNQNLE